ncbi:MAG: PEGA domain-containing protein [Deltaproteobacteria bacterium]|nr:PEGA domain-containing protein [Deltaproteobacteria bacterium]
MRSFTARTALIALTMLLVAGSAAAGGKADREARKQFEQGIQLFNESKYEQAAIAFERAYELKPSFKLLYNVGQVENELGNFVAARDAYTRYLEEGGDQVPQERGTQVRAEIERLEALIGTIEIVCPVDGATVYIDGRDSGQTPFDQGIAVDSGEREVAIKHAGDELHREVVRVAGGAVVVVDVEVGREPVDSAEPAPTAEPVESEKRPRLWTWVALGVGGAAAVGAAITGSMAASHAGDLDNACDGGECPEEEWDNLDQTRALATATNVMIGVAAVGVAAGVALYFIEPRIGASGESVEVVPTASTDSVGVMVGGRF